MKELWEWRYTDEFGKRRTFPCKLSEEAAKHYRDAERVEGSLEIRTPLGSTSDSLRSLPMSPQETTMNAPGSSSSSDSS
jgi:hypothetical protein